MAEELTYEAVDFYDDQEELHPDSEAIRRQDDPDIDGKGLRRQQMTVHGVGVIPHYAHIDHPRAIQAQNHVIGVPRRSRVGILEVCGNTQPVHRFAQVDLMTGFCQNTGGTVALPSRTLPDEVHPTDFSLLSLADALTQEDLALTESGGAIHQVRKGRTTRPVRLR